MWQRRVMNLVGGVATFIVAMSGRVWAEAPAEPPLKVDVHPKAGAQNVDAPVPLQITLRDAYNRPALARTDVQIRVDIMEATGKAQSMDVSVKSGESTADFSWQPTAPGIVTVKVREKQNALLDGASALLVKPAAPTLPTGAVPAGPASAVKASRPKKKRARIPSSPAQPGAELGTAARTGSIAGVDAGTSKWARSPVFAQVQSVAVAAVTHRPAQNLAGQVNMQVSARDIGGIFADGKEYAKVDVFYVTADGSSAPTDITVWFHWQGGEISPQPLLIKKGEVQAQARWAARSPVEGKLQIAAVSPGSMVVGGEVTQRFVRPVKGLVVSGPDTMTVVDVGQLLVQFEDLDGNVVNTDTGRKVSFLAETTAIDVDPKEFPLEAGDAEARVRFIPRTFAGNSAVRVTTAGYPPRSHKIHITWILILFLTVLGGVLGGILRFFKSRGHLLRRIVIGVVVGAVAVFGYVTGVLPVAATLLLHNVISVPIAALLAGWLGLELLDRIPGASIITGAPSPAHSPAPASAPVIAPKS